MGALMKNSAIQEQSAGKTRQGPIRQYLLDISHAIGSMSHSSGVRKNLNGNLVQIEDGPAAVTGDESCINVTDLWVGKTQPLG